MRGGGGSAPNRSLTSAAAAAAAAASSPASAEPRLSPRSRDRFAALCWWWCPPLRSLSLLEPGVEAEVEGVPAAERFMLGNLFYGQCMRTVFSVRSTFSPPCLQKIFSYLSFLLLFLLLEEDEFEAAESFLPPPPPPPEDEAVRLSEAAEAAAGTEDEDETDMLFW